MIRKFVASLMAALMLATFVIPADAASFGGFRGGGFRASSFRSSSFSSRSFSSRPSTSFFRPSRPAVAPVYRPSYSTYTPYFSRPTVVQHNTVVNQSTGGGFFSNALSSFTGIAAYQYFFGDDKKDEQAPAPAAPVAPAVPAEAAAPAAAPVVPGCVPQPQEPCPVTPVVEAPKAQ